jgi:hypothetical protein
LVPGVHAAAYGIEDGIIGFANVQRRVRLNVLSVLCPRFALRKVRVKSPAPGPLVFGRDPQGVGATPARLRVMVDVAQGA